MYRPVQEQDSRPKKEKKRSVNTSRSFKNLANWKKIILVSFIIYLLFIGKGLYNQEQTIKVKQQEVERLEQELNALKAENEKIESRFDRLHDEDYIAEIARQNYYLSKPGEVLFIIPQGR